MTKKIKVYQIGIGSFGRHGFEHLVDMHQHMEKVDIQLEGICDINPERLEQAKRYAKTHNLEIETFQEDEEMYRKAKEEQEESEEVIIYDAGPSEIHAEHIYKSIRHNFFHLAEKPPSINREERIHEKKLAKDKPVFWKVDFIERESPVVKKTLEILSEEDNIDEIKVFRESTAGIQKIINPVDRSGVIGGDILDKMVNEIYILDILEETGQRPNLKLEEAHNKYFLPFKENSDSFMTVRGSKTNNLTSKTATGMTQAVFDSGKTSIKLNSSWLGISEEALNEIKKHDLETGDIIKGEIKHENQHLFSEEEARFFIMEGSRNILGDLLNNKLYDLDEDEEIETPELMHNQLYRILEKAILQAAGEKRSDITEEEIDIFMNSIFNVKDEISNKDYETYQELSKGRERVQEKMMKYEDFDEDSENET